MFEGFADPMQYGFAIFLFGGWVGLFYMIRLLFIGTLCTGRELAEKEARIAALEQALHTRDQQVGVALHVLPDVADVLKKFHAAGEEVRKGAVS